MTRRESEGVRESYTTSRSRHSGSSHSMCSSSWAPGAAWRCHMQEERCVSGPRRAEPGPGATFW